MSEQTPQSEIEVDFQCFVDECGAALKPIHQCDKTPHEITCDLLIAARRVLFNPNLPPTDAALKGLSDAVIAFEDAFVRGGKL